MTNPKENTDLKEQIKQIIALTVHDSGVHEVEGLDWDSIDEAAEAIEKLVHQARVDELKKASTQLDYSEPGEWFDARIKELESKEESNG